MCRASRAGYTLLELLLVVGILMICAGAVAPSVMGMLANYHLKEGVQKAQAALAATRVHAVDATSTYQFRYEPGGRHFLAIPVDTDALSSPGPAMAPNGTSLAPSMFEAGLLPEGLSFQASASGATPSPAQTQAQMPAANDPGWTAALAHVPDTHDFAQVNWSDPICFHPDGTASDATFTVVDTRGIGYRFTIREITGEIFVHSLETGSH
ncbi:MAG TPA: type II secretion system protein [Planctomycetaceae bacterium]|nr:type II secretion system protein [Planctomycetaceae bacterium]